MTEEFSFSLAELAGFDSSDIAAIASRLPEPGLYTVRCDEIGFIAGQQREDDDRPPLHRLVAKMFILDAKPLNKKIDPDKLIEKNLPWSYPMFTTDIEKTIGLLKGQYAKIGLPTDGVMGGFHDDESGTQIEGWIDGLLGQQLDIRVNVRGERVFYDFVPPKKTESEEADA